MAGLVERLWRWPPRAAPSAPVPIDPLDFGAADFVRDPYPALAYLRREQPLHRAARGAWVLSRHADIAQALQDPRLGNAPAPCAVIHGRNRGRYVCADVAANSLPFLDGSHHASLRSVLAAHWTAQLREQPPQIEDRAREMLDRCRRRGEFDLLSDFATPLAVSLIADVLGVPEALRDSLHRDAQWFFYLFTGLPSQQTREQTDQALSRLRARFSALLDRATAGPRASEGLIGRVAQMADGALPREVLADNLVLLWADGIENVDKGIAAAFALLLSHAEQWRALCSDPALVRRAAAECLRYETPGQFIGRIVLEPLELHGQSLAAGQAVLLMLASANRDEAQFADPDRFDIHRDGSGGLGFGRGHHSCLGAALARSEIEAALQVAASEAPQLRLRSPNLEWQPRMGHRWLARLPVVLR